jgi:hypothetical protein
MTTVGEKEIPLFSADKFSLDGVKKVWPKNCGELIAMKTMKISYNKDYKIGQLIENPVYNPDDTSVVCHVEILPGGEGAWLFAGTYSSTTVKDSAKYCAEMAVKKRSFLMALVSSTFNNEGRTQ